MTTPDGEEIEGVNLTGFCKEQGLPLDGFRRILRGEIEHHKGWRIRRLEDNQP